MLVHIAIGDAYGSGFEFKPKDFVELHNTDKLSYLPHSLSSREAGCYTDDTQMSLAIAEHIIEGGKWTQEDVAQRFIDVFRRDPRDTYAKHFNEFLQTVRTGEDFMKKIKNDSNRSGAAMRSLPLGVIPDLGRLKNAAFIQASTTHNTHEGRDSSFAVALIGHYLYYAKGPVKDLPLYLKDQIPGYAWDLPWVGRVPSEGIPCVRAALTVLTGEMTLCVRDVLRAAVAFTGDVDTVAALALGAIMLDRERASWSIPAHLKEGLETGRYGRTYLFVTERKLMRPRRSWKTKDRSFASWGGW